MYSQSFFMFEKFNLIWCKTLNFDPSISDFVTYVNRKHHSAPPISYDYQQYGSLLHDLDHIIL